MPELNNLTEASVALFYQMLEAKPLLKPSLEGVLTYEENQTRMQRLANSGDWRGLTDFVHERSSAKLYKDALSYQVDYSSKFEKLSEAMLDPNRRSKLVNRAVALAGAIELREKTLAYRVEHEKYAHHVAKITEYRVLTARAAQLASLLREQDEKTRGVFLTYEEDTLGALEVGGDFEINSQAWHDARAAGIGGSDVGAIMRVDPAFGSQNYLKVLNEKLGRKQLEEDPLAFARDDLTTAIGRGNAWEEFIRHEVQDRHPELRVGFCKSSWHGTGEYVYRHANFDGLFLDENSVPEGVLEIKTGSNSKKWGAEKDGFKGVPAGYRKQILWYAANAGLKWGKVVAILSDYDYREYDFSLDDPQIQAEVEEIYEATDKFWRDLPQKRSEYELSAGKAFSKYSALSPKESPDSIAEVLSGYAGIPKAEAKKFVVEAISEAQGAEKRELSREELQAVVFSIFALHDPKVRNRPLVGIDIETNTTSARTGRIIETGIVSYSSESETFEIVYDSLHGLPKVALNGVGVGATNVHHITPERLIGKGLFEEDAAEILELLMDSTLVAHNAGFEDRFLSANLPGYIEAKAEGRITILDTRKVAKYLMPRSSDNTLQSFAEDNGIPYEGAHAAGQDALMMMRALMRLQKTIYNGGRFVTRRASASARMNAVQHALESEAGR